MESVTHSCLDVLELNYSSVRPGTPPSGVMSRVSPPPPSADAGRGAEQAGAGYCSLGAARRGQRRGSQWALPHLGPASLHPQQWEHYVLLLSVTMAGWGCCIVCPPPPPHSSPALGSHWVPSPAATAAAKNMLPAAGQPRAREAAGNEAGARGYSQRAAGLFLAGQY